jgi:2-polyprenyl-3-methyl-5-hydroxy-6-metoxy-1,4-benzoquinol methylase
LLDTTTNPGLHDYVLNQLRRRFPKPSGRAIDLGAGTGALAVRLRELGWDVQAADINAPGFEADIPFVPADLNQRHFAASLGESTFQLVTAVEVLEHVESPINFLWNVGRLLTPGGVALLTTPNVDSAPARIKFLLTGKIRMMDETSEPTHISPIFWDLLVRQYLPRAGLQLLDHFLYPPDGHLLTRRRHAWAARSLGWLVAGDSLKGDNHVLVLKAQG